MEDFRKQSFGLGVRVVLLLVLLLDEELCDIIREYFTCTLGHRAIDWDELAFFIH